MSFSVKNKGMKEAQRAMNEALASLDDTSEDMLYVMMAALSAQTLPFVPVDTSALINSEYRKIKTASGRVSATFGYGAPGATAGRGTPVQKYAVYVHDGPQKNWQKPGASNRYLAKGVRRFLREDLDGIIAEFMR